MGCNAQRTLSFLLALIVLLPGCFGSDNDPPSDDSVDPPDDPVDPPALPCADGFNTFGSEPVISYEGFEQVENEDPQNTIFNRWEGGHNESYHIVSDSVGYGEKAFRIDITPNETTQSAPDRDVKNRVEFGISPGHLGCDEVWYGWSFMIPVNFTDKPENGSGFNVIAQWHSQSGDPDNPSSTNPPISVVYGTQNGVTGIGLKYGLNDVNRHFMAEEIIEKGVWYDLIFHIGWSEDWDGFTEVWMDGEMITNGTVLGPNMHNWRAHYWKAGMYRGAVGQDSTLTNNSIYYDEFRIGQSYDAVNPNQVSNS